MHFSKPTLEETRVEFAEDLYVNNTYVQAQRERWAQCCFQETFALFSKFSV